MEDQQRADERIPLLLQTPAAVRFLSCEPLLGPVGLEPFLQYPPFHEHYKMTFSLSEFRGMDWIIAGGESGPGARTCNLAWIRSLIQQCQAAQVPCFVKQLGRCPIAEAEPLPAAQSVDSLMRHGEYDPEPIVFRFRDPKGGDPSEWPTDLRVRQFPEVKP